jgi:hypothetical protein
MTKRNEIGKEGRNTSYVFFYFKSAKKTFKKRLEDRKNNREQSER